MNTPNYENEEIPEAPATFEAESPKAQDPNEAEGSQHVSPEAESSQATPDEAESLEDEGSQSESSEDAPHPEPDVPPLPVALPVLFENIPEYLRSLKRWALWCYDRDEENGALCRVHHRPDGSPAEPTEHWTWSSLSAVQTAYESGGYDGISLAIGGEGLVLDDSILVGVRLSRQRAQNEDGSWSARPGEALELARRLDSYTELNEQGSGLHILVRATLPDALRTSRPTPGTTIPRQFLIDFDHLMPVTGHLLSCDGGAVGGKGAGRRHRGLRGGVRHDLHPRSRRPAAHLWL
jgi:hypothetical protein